MPSDSRHPASCRVKVTDASDRQNLLNWHRSCLDASHDCRAEIHHVKSLHTDYMGS